MKPVKLKPHQQKAVDELENGKILWGGVGTGKTITSLVYYFTKVMGGVTGDFGSIRNPMDLVVITTAKKRDSLDWQEDAMKLGIGWDRQGSPEGISMTVDSWNNIHKYLDRKNTFFIFDEQRVVGSGKWAKNFIKIATKNDNQWILLSATPGDTWMDYIPVFVANGWYRNKSDFIDQHVVFNTYQKFPKVDRYTSVNKLVKYRNHILVEMPYERHTTRKTTTLDVDYDKELFEMATKRRWNPFTEAPMRDVAELFRVMRQIVNSDPHRIWTIKTLMCKHPRLIIFYNFDYELQELRKLERFGRILVDGRNADSGAYLKVSDVEALEDSESRSDGLKTSLEGHDKTFALAEWNGHKHQEVPETDHWVYLVQYTAGSEGWNCITTDAMVFYSLTYSYKAWHQAFGRIDRLNTPFHVLNYYILKSKSMIDKAIATSLNEKRNFNENDFKDALEMEVEIVDHDYYGEEAA